MSGLRNLNYLKHMAYHPCQAGGDPLLYIETGFQALLPLLFAFNTFSCMDILKLRAGISWKCGRKLRAMIEHGTPPKTYDNIHFLYSLGPNLVERALWFMFVAELASDFVVNWSSLIYAGLGCTGPMAGGFHTGITPGGVYNGGFGPLQVLGVQTNNCGGLGGYGVTVAAGCTATMSYNLETQPYGLAGSPPYTVETWIQDGSGNKFAFGSGKSDGGVNKTGTISSATPPNRALIGQSETYGIYGHCSNYMQTLGGPFDCYLAGHKPELAGANCLSRHDKSQFQTHQP